ncbi:CIC11C00000004357 [Sungouiella intermedia]|uniref:CIC11C00000004357 n=1 Tax=Sungouiella intermedia TaxID=45354 RepID=A0A1L0BNS3_9ASCO|nr:CIC11C00000004357 [[Candida] intermedia]
MARQNFVGLVVSQGKMNKTVKVRVQTKAYDKRVHKEVIQRKDYLVHDEGNLCKEGDIVRIETIPKISARKYFAIAEIKVNKGQQFALYETLAKQKVAQEEQLKITEYLQKKQDFEATIEKVEDLKNLDRISKSIQSPEADKQALLDQINEIKQKYGITSWPSPEPVLKLEVNEAAKDLSVVENRIAHIKQILDKFMSSEFAAQRLEVLASLNKNAEELQPHTIKNILRKYVLDPRNEVPFTL